MQALITISRPRGGIVHVAGEMLRAPAPSEYDSASRNCMQDLPRPNQTPTIGTWRLGASPTRSPNTERCLLGSDPKRSLEER